MAKMMIVLGDEDVSSIRRAVRERDAPGALRLLTQVVEPRLSQRSGCRGARPVRGRSSAGSANRSGEY